jgi:T3SS (YopN, CesT) and YbjN peptide-binding chaperone 1
MGLFGKSQEGNLKSSLEMVTKVITELNLSPDENRLETDDGSHAWGLMRGSAQVFIFLKPGEDQDSFNTLQIVAPVMRLPESSKNQGILFQKLLELNAREITGAAFGLKDETVVITTDRSTEDLDRSEVKDMILRIGYFADHFDDELVTQYGGRRFSD